MDGLMKRVPIAVLLLALLALLGMAACGNEEPTAAHPVPSWAKVAPEQIAEAREHGVPVAFENDLGMRFVLIPAGTFLMGQPRMSSFAGKRYQHEATVSEPFYLQTTEVTNAQYRRFVADHICAELDDYDLEGADHPVCTVTWNEAVAFATWAGARLPTEVEWERAARGGLVGKEYPWGDAWDPSRVNGLGPDDGHEQSAPVEQFPPNAYGLYDMTGNVEEWVLDRWKPHEDGSGSVFSERMSLDGKTLSPEETARLDRIDAEEAQLPHRTVKGGSWFGPNLDCARRFGLAEIRRSIAIGFRLALPVPKKSR